MSKENKRAKGKTVMKKSLVVIVALILGFVFFSPLRFLPEILKTFINALKNWRENLRNRKRNRMKY